jgi:hypothetical protein
MVDPHIPHAFLPPDGLSARPTESLPEPDVALVETTPLLPFPSPPSPATAAAVSLPSPSLLVAGDTTRLHTTMLPPSPGVARESETESVTETEAEIATHKRSAQRTRAEAAELAGLVEALTEALSRLMTRRRALVGRSDLTRSEAGELAELEHTISDCSQHLADLWLRWTTLVVQAHDHEQRARYLRSRGQ